MIDATTQKPLCVSTNGGMRPFMIVPLSQLDTILSLLDENKLSYSVDEEALSLDGKPEVVFIDLGRRTDPALLQSLLDSVP